MPSEFFQSGVQADVKHLVDSCDICEKITPRCHTKHAPLGRTLVIDTPFRRVAVDIIRSLRPPSLGGNKFRLVMANCATRFPEAVALSSIETEEAAEAWVNTFRRVGAPDDSLNVRGSKFISELMKEIARLLSLRHLTTTPSHPVAYVLV